MPPAETTDTVAVPDASVDWPECSNQPQHVGKARESCVAATPNCSICDTGLVCQTSPLAGGNQLFGTCVPPCPDGGTLMFPHCCAMPDPDHYGWCADP